MAAFSTPFDRFLTAPAVAGRIARACPVVVWVECRNGAPMPGIELDAESVEHGRRIAFAWIANMGAISTSIREVLPDGETRSIEIVSQPMPDDFWEAA